MTTEDAIARVERFTAAATTFSEKVIALRVRYKLATIYMALLDSLRVHASAAQDAKLMDLMDVVWYAMPTKQQLQVEKMLADLEDYDNGAKMPRA